MMNALQRLNKEVDEIEERREKRAAYKAIVKVANNLGNKHNYNVKLNKKQRKEFEEISRPLIKFLNDNFHPHVKVVIDCTSAELLEGIYNYRTEDYLKD